MVCRVFLLQQNKNSSPCLIIAKIWHWWLWLALFLFFLSSCFSYTYEVSLLAVIFLIEIGRLFIFLLAICVSFVIIFPTPKEMEPSGRWWSHWGYCPKKRLMLVFWNGLFLMRMSFYQKWAFCLQSEYCWLVLPPFWCHPLWNLYRAWEQVNTMLLSNILEHWP